MATPNRLRPRHTRGLLHRTPRGRKAWRRTCQRTAADVFKRRDVIKNHLNVACRGDPDRYRPAKRTLAPPPLLPKAARMLPALAFGRYARVARTRPQTRPSSRKKWRQWSMSMMAL